MNELVIALAVAYAESGWQYSAKGGPNNNGTYDWGLFQINDVHKPTANEKTNPLANAKAAQLSLCRSGQQLHAVGDLQRAYKGHPSSPSALSPRSKSVEATSNAKPGKPKRQRPRQSVLESLNNASLLLRHRDIAKGPEKVIGFFDMSLAVLLGIVLFVLGMMILARGSAARVVTGDL